MKELSLEVLKEINWNQQSTKDFIINTIKYAVLRDEFRRLNKN